MKPKELKFPYTWEERRPNLGDQILFVPLHYFAHDEWVKRPFFDNNNPVYVEYCSGNGEWILDRATESPDVNWIAVEMKFERVAKIYSKMKNRGIKNVLVVCGEAQPFTKWYLESSSVDRIYVNFPDPWPKRRHAKNRLLQGEFLSEMARIMRPKGRMALVTDDPGYAKWSLQQMHNSKRWISTLDEPFVTLNDAEYGSSYFDRLWREKGREIQLLEFSPVREVEVDLSLSSRLQFEPVEGERILWRFNFGLNRHLQKFRDELAFQSYRLGVGHFLETLHDDRSKAFLLYDGPIDFVDEFYRSEVDMVDFSEWLRAEYRSVANFRERTGFEVASFDELDRKEMIEDPMGRQLMRLFALETLSDYLHRLSALLPDEVLACVRFDCSGVESEAMIAQLLSKERFSHLHILGREQIESPKGICLPPDEWMGLEVYSKIDELLGANELRIIPEGLLNESWQCLDEVIVIPEALTKMGKRMVEGFTAAGGVVQGA